MVNYPEYPPWDYSHLYEHIHRALTNMEPYIVGNKSQHIITHKEKRRFYEAIELARRTKDGDHVRGEHVLFLRKTKAGSVGLLEESPPGYHAIVIKNRKKFQVVYAELVATKQHVERLTYLIGRYSTRWWD